jgi:catechol 2,3-dioxygenase-like lactoylglutathione lyase family enzyme
MTHDIDHLHHVGLVVHDMEEALAVYRRLGFEMEPPAYPMLAKEGADPVPFGAANTHAYFTRSFVELVTIISEGSKIPADANLVPLQIPPEHLAQVTESITHTVDRFAARLERFQGLHRLVFHSSDADAVARRLTATGIVNSGVNTIQRPVDTAEGPKVETIRHIEIGGGDRSQAESPEGILAIAESLQAHRRTEHPNGAVDLVEVVLAVASGEVGATSRRYASYLDRAAEGTGTTSVFRLEGARVTIVTNTDLDALLPGEQAPTLPALVAYAVAVRDIAEAERLLHANGFSTAESVAGDLFVPAQAALGTAVIFREVS